MKLNKNKFITVGSKQDDDDSDDKYQEQSLVYFERQQAISEVVVPIDGPIKDAGFYRNIVQRLESAGANDSFIFRITSPGGNLHGLVSLLEAIKETEAQVVANIVGDAHSAASMLALNCPMVVVGDYANMLVHFVSFGSGGKATDMKNHVQHVFDYSSRIFRETYQYFLTEQEIEDVIAGKELWFQAEEIHTRLERKVAMHGKENTDSLDPSDSIVRFDLLNQSEVSEQETKYIPVPKTKKLKN